MAFIADALPWLSLILTALILYAIARRTRNKDTLPPGPRPLPIIGNVLDIPTENMPSAFHDLTMKYGEVVYLDALGQPMIVLGTHEAAVELLDKRSSIYSDRHTYVMSDMVGWNWLFTSHQYGLKWRRYRKMFHQHFNASAVLPYREVQEDGARRLAHNLITDPKNFMQHIRLAFASTIMRVAYGIEVEDVNSEYVHMAEAALAVFSAVFVPGRYAVEMFPVLRYLPSWFPGAKFKREAEAWEPAVDRLQRVPWERTMAKIREGTAIPSIATRLVDRISKLTGDERAAEETIAKGVAGAAYAGGADTTLSSVQSIFMAMAMFPEAQRQAQAELDAVVGPHRLPEFADMRSLPYICALAKECLRWRSVLPLGFTHRSIEDDVFRGYCIPKGTLVIVNPWAYSRDVRCYPDPEAFLPERFLKDGKLDPDALDPATFAFGYGRRICPGRHFAEASLFILAATVLHTLTISAPLDADGNPVRLAGTMTPGVISYPEPFEVDIKPRAPWAEALVKESCGPTTKV